MYLLENLLFLIIFLLPDTQQSLAGVRQGKEMCYGKRFRITQDFAGARGSRYRLLNLLIIAARNNVE